MIRGSLDLCKLLYQDEEDFIWYLGNTKYSAKSVRVFWKGRTPDE